MTLITVLIVVAAEFYFKWGAEHRHFSWFDALSQQFNEKFADTPWFHGPLGALAITVLPLLVLCLVMLLVPAWLEGLVFFMVSVAVLFYSLGPMPLERSLDGYFEAIERGDKEGAYLILQRENLVTSSDSDQVVRSATKSMLFASQTRYFSPLFWFIFFGPFGALFYRLCRCYLDYSSKQGLAEHESLLMQIIHWADWVPARATSAMFLLSGDFVSGFYRVRDYWLDASSDARHLIAETGIAALGLDMQSSDEEPAENYDALAMIRRTIIIFLFVVAALSPLSIWA